MSAAAKKAKGQVILCAPIATSKTEDRVIIELDEGGWAVGRVPRGKKGDVTIETRFDMDAIQEAAMWGISGDPKIRDALSGEAGKGLAAAALILLMALGIAQSKAHG